MIRTDETIGHAWALRWDDAANATEFARLFRTYADRRGLNASVRRTNPDSAATVLLLGDREFVRAASVSENATDVELLLSKQANATSIDRQRSTF